MSAGYKNRLESSYPGSFEWGGKTIWKFKSFKVVRALWTNLAQNADVVIRQNFINRLKFKEIIYVQKGSQFFRKEIYVSNT